MAVLDDLKTLVTELQLAVQNEDIEKVKANSGRISDIVQKLPFHIPDHPTKEQQELIREIVGITQEINKLLDLRIDFVRLAIRDIQDKEAQNHNWTA